MKTTNTTLLFLILISAGCAETSTDTSASSGTSNGEAASAGEGEGEADSTGEGEGEADSAGGGRLFGEEVEEGECPASCDEVFNVEKLEQEIDVATAEVPVEVEVDVCLQPNCAALAEQYEQAKVARDTAKENLAAAKEQEATQSAVSGVTVKTGRAMRWVVYEYECQESEPPETVIASSIDMDFAVYQRYWWNNDSPEDINETTDLIEIEEGELKVDCISYLSGNPANWTFRITLGYLN